MKTFETEKHNIPEGATHYRDECEDFRFAWVMFDDGELMVDTIAIGWSRFKHSEFEAKVKPIPQTKEVEWENGDEVVISKSSRSKWFVVGVSPVTGTSTICASNTGELKSFHTNQLKKPETPEAKKEREELEAVKDAMSTIDAEIGDRSDVEGVVLRMIKAGYRVEK